MLPTWPTYNGRFIKRKKEADNGHWPGAILKSTWIHIVRVFHNWGSLLLSGSCSVCLLVFPSGLLEFWFYLLDKKFERITGWAEMRVDDQ